MIDKQRIAKLYSHGVPQNVIAQAVGITAGRLSQLIAADSEVIELISTHAGEIAEQSAEQDKSIRDIEDSILQRMEAVVYESESPLELARTYEIIQNARLKDRALSGASKAENSSLVTINLAVMREAKEIDIRTSKDRQIIEIESQSMAPLDNESLTKLLNAPVNEGQTLEEFFGAEPGDDFDELVEAQIATA